MSFDYIALNLCGYVSYSIFNGALYWDVDVQRSYADAFGSSSSAVQLNDVAFAFHGLVLTSATALQIAIYDRGAQRFSRPCKLIVLVLVLLGALGGVLTAAGVVRSPLPLLYALSATKLGVTIGKYIPQVALNIRRGSTKGWSIDNVLLDLTGGTLSLVQVLLDAGCTGDYSKVVGDPVKVGLGVVTLLFDTCFVIQHYAIYGKANAKAATLPLLLAPEGSSGEPDASQTPRAATTTAAAAVASGQDTCHAVGRINALAAEQKER